jgi:pimeloyl-ACP methyl ester carboxylesterase
MPEWTRRLAPRSPSGWILASAAALAACAAVVHLKVRRTERHNPPKGRFIDVDGVRLHLREWGDTNPHAPTLVLLHGNGSLADEWELSGLVGQAVTQHRVIAFDRPGYGHSSRPPDRAWTPEAQADLFQAALQSLGVQRPVVLGHSWGAQVALALGLRHPASVGSLVLMSGYYFPSLRLDVPLGAIPALPLLGTLMRHTVSPLLGRLIWPLVSRKLFLPAAVTPAFAERFPAWMSLRPSQLRAAAAESARMMPNAIRLGRQLHTLSVPTVIVAGAGDLQALPGWHSVRLQRRLPQSELRLIDGAGHMVHHVATAEVMASIERAAELASQAGRQAALVRIAEAEAQQASGATMM